VEPCSSRAPSVRPERVLGATDVAFARARLNLGALGFALDASSRAGDDYFNRVAGIDMSWLPTASDNILAQWLTSNTRDAPATASLDARAGHAWDVEWTHGSARLPWMVRHQRIDRDFRADVGYIPAADVVDSYVKGGPRFFEKGVFNEVQLYVEAEQQKVASSRTPIDRWIAPGWEFQAPHNTFGSVPWHGHESVRAFAGSPLRTTRFVRFDASTSPGARWAKIRMYGDVGG
jgi:hypothetical protein